jgi:RNA polymerase sigma-70 factor (ECF subfamily)
MSSKLTDIRTADPTHWSDEELRGRMLAHEAKAWREFHRRFDRLIYRCIQKVTARFRRVVGEEDLQEIHAMLMLDLTAANMRKLRRFDPARGNKFSSWIGLLTTNMAWDYLRGLSRRPNCDEAVEPDPIDMGPDPYERLAQRERWDLVTETLQTLSRKDRDFVRMYYMDECSPEEIARQMRISVKTVYTKKHKIRSRLAEALTEHRTAA